MGDPRKIIDPLLIQHIHYLNNVNIIVDDENGHTEDEIKHMIRLITGPYLEKYFGGGDEYSLPV